MENIYKTISKKQFKIDKIISLEKFRRFLIYACYFPNKDKDTIDFLLKNKKFFPMRIKEGKINYIADEIFPYEFRKKIVIVYFKNLKEIEYNSRSGSSKLKWIRINDIAGKLIGVASFRALMIFYHSKAFSLKEIEEIIKVNSNEAI
ncbi:MAG: hypothetical protein QW272_08115 [Candidatus Methanomethylicaceae archaeon]